MNSKFQLGVPADLFTLVEAFIQIKKSLVDHISQITLVCMLADLIKKLSRSLDGKYDV